MAGKIFIYGLMDSRDDEIYYVGQTVDLSSRLAQHLREKGSKPKNRWLGELQSAGLMPYMWILQVSDTESWENDEKEWIAYGHEQGWPLTNLTAGGRCGGGIKTLEQRAMYGLREFVIPLVGKEQEIVALPTDEKLTMLHTVALATIASWMRGRRGRDDYNAAIQLAVDEVLEHGCDEYQPETSNSGTPYDTDRSSGIEGDWPVRTNHLEVFEQRSFQG